MTAQTMQIGNKPCRIYGEAHAKYLLLQMTGEHELQSMESEIAAIAQSAHHFLFAAMPGGKLERCTFSVGSPLPCGESKGLAVRPRKTLHFLTEQVIPTLEQQYPLPENVKIILGGYSLAGTVCAVGLHPDRSVLRCRRRLALGVVSGLDGV